MPADLGLVLGSADAQSGTRNTRTHPPSASAPRMASIFASRAASRIRRERSRARRCANWRASWGAAPKSAGRHGRSASKAPMSLRREPWRRRCRVSSSIRLALPVPGKRQSLPFLGKASGTVPGGNGGAGIAVCGPAGGRLFRVQQQRGWGHSGSSPRALTQPTITRPLDGLPCDRPDLSTPAACSGTHLHRLRCNALGRPTSPGLSGQ